MHDPRRRSPKQDDDLLLKSMLCFRFAEIRFLISNRSGPGGVITWDDFIRDPLGRKIPPGRIHSCLENIDGGNFCFFRLSLLFLKMGRGGLALLISVIDTLSYTRLHFTLSSVDSKPEFIDRSRWSTLRYGCPSVHLRPISIAHTTPFLSWDCLIHIGE